MLKPLGVLILAHLLADFVLQPESLIALKLKKHKQGKFWNSGIFWHSVVHLAVSAALLSFGARGAGPLFTCGCAFAEHYLIDRFKSLWKFQRTWCLSLTRLCILPHLSHPAGVRLAAALFRDWLWFPLAAQPAFKPGE
jgi:hypothetical protein